MTKQGHSKQDLIEYLLGSLSETEAERFDALSVSDKDFADELSAVETDLVDAYVQGELTGQTLTRFEGHYLASPLRREKVEFARELQSYGRNYGAKTIEPAGVAATPERAHAGFLAWLGFFTKQSRAMRWGLAAAAAVLMTAGTWWIFHAGGNPAMASFVLKPQMRGRDQITMVSVTSRITELVIQLQLEADDYAKYQVALKEAATGTELWRSGMLTTANLGGSKTVEVRVPARLLQSKIYSLVVSGIGRDGTTELVGDYPFRAEVK